jgi:hypothetical protein
MTAGAAAKVWGTRTEEVSMSPERSNAYRRVLDAVAELGPTKLHDAEQDQIRYAADSLIFCADLDDDEASRDALTDTRSLLDSLVESGRWEQATADRLAADLRECGPNAEPVGLGAV